MPLPCRNHNRIIINGNKIQGFVKGLLNADKAFGEIDNSDFANPLINRCIRKQ
jgi:hypothetical protein